MKLEIGNFYVKDIVFGDELSFKNGILTVDKEAALNFIREDDRITEAELYIAKPGDKIRITPVKEAIEPRVRLDGKGLFPGYTQQVYFVDSGPWNTDCCNDHVHLSADGHRVFAENLINRIKSL